MNASAWKHLRWWRNHEITAHHHGWEENDNDCCLVCFAKKKKIRSMLRWAHLYSHWFCQRCPGKCIYLINTGITSRWNVSPEISTHSLLAAPNGTRCLQNTNSCICFFHDPFFCYWGIDSLSSTYLPIAMTLLSILYRQSMPASKQSLPIIPA